MYTAEQNEDLNKRLQALIGETQQNKFIDRIQKHLPLIIAEKLIKNFIVGYQKQW